MLRQIHRRRSRWLEGQSRRNRHIYCIRRLHRIQHHRSLLYSVAYGW
ncbi:chpB toxin of the ChpB-ChpS toxin-antitoxin system [Edwardsiella anguillarum]|nr:chpB toxin of the ChpB-ChpS toxin-antitoxin system [Edwardsiella anguillarum]